jgi:hypothetical protein
MRMGSVKQYTQGRGRYERGMLLKRRDGKKYSRTLPLLSIASIISTSSVGMFEKA